MSNSRYTPSEIQEQFVNPRLAYISHSKYEQDWYSACHSHPFIELSFIEDGEGVFIIDNEEYAVTQGDLVIILPNTMHTEKSSQKAPLEYFFLGVDNMLVPTHKEGKRAFMPVLSLDNQARKIHSFFADIYREMQQKQPGYMLMAQGLLLQFAAFLARQAHVTSFFTDKARINKECAQVKQFLDEHYSDKITLEDLSEKNGISKYHLIHEFGKYLGTSPINYLIERRINEAKTLLISTEMSIVDISASVGFSSPSHFSLRFKASTGLSPLQFRKMTHTQS